MFLKHIYPIVSVLALHMIANTAQKMVKEKKEVVVMRITKDLRDRLNTLADKRKATITSLTNQAIAMFLNQEEYNFEDFMNIVETIPSLNLHKEMIKKEMIGCPPGICKEIIEIIKDKNAFVFDENFDTIKKKIESLEKQNELYGIHLHISVKENHTNEINDIIKSISNTFKNKKIKINAAVKENSNIENKILLFVSYNKKEDDIK